MEVGKRAWEERENKGREGKDGGEKVRTEERR